MLSENSSHVSRHDYFAVQCLQALISTLDQSYLDRNCDRKSVNKQLVKSAIDLADELFIQLLEGELNEDSNENT